MKFKKYLLESEKKETLNEAGLQGIVGTIAGFLGFSVGLGMSAPLLATAGAALTIAGVIETLTSLDVTGSRNHGIIMKYLHKIKSERDLKNLGEKDVKKIIDAAAELKNELSRGQKGVITKYENQLTRAFKSQDSTEIMRLLKKLTEELEKER